jgi:hypothetical protein
LVKKEVGGRGEGASDKEFPALNKTQPKDIEHRCGSRSGFNRVCGFGYRKVKMTSKNNKIYVRELDVLQEPGSPSWRFKMKKISGR